MSYWICAKILVGFANCLDFIFSKSLSMHFGRYEFEIEVYFSVIYLDL